MAIDSEQGDTVEKCRDLLNIEIGENKEQVDLTPESSSNDKVVLSTHGTSNLLRDTSPNISVGCQEVPHDSNINKTTTIPLSTTSSQKTFNILPNILPYEIKNDASLNQETPGKRKRVQHDYRRLSSSGYVDDVEGRDRFSSTSESEFSTSPTPPKVKPIKLALCKMRGELNSNGPGFDTGK